MAFDTITTDSNEDNDPQPQQTGRLSGSAQQQAFWDALINGNDHILLNALAGTGKSSSAREGMHRLVDSFGDLSIKYTCFGKAIADEFRPDCPRNADVGTLHSFGFRALSRAFGSSFDQQKTYTILDSLGGPEKRYIRSSISKLVSVYKSTEPFTPVSLETLALFHDINLWNQDQLIFDWSYKVVDVSDMMTSMIDFDDMLRLPVIHNLDFPTVDFLFIDEAQDLNPIQHAMAERLSGTGRTIVIGDPQQAIYMFRGADANSIPRLRDRLGASVYPLTVTRRCPKSHVELARELVPAFEAAPEAPEGTLERGGLGLLESAGPGGLVLCRMNAPLIDLCLRMVASRRKATVRGRAIGDSLHGVIRQVSGTWSEANTVADWCRQLGRWKARQLARLESKDGAEALVEKVMDQSACLEAIASTCGSPAEIPGVINQLFSEGSAADRITFSSIHRSKGSEARRVYLIDVPYSVERDRKRPPADWELGQRRNLRYVALTRSKEYLGIIESNRDDSSNILRSYNNQGSLFDI